MKELGINLTALLRQFLPLLVSLAVGGVLALYFDRAYGADSKVDVAAFAAAVTIGLAANIRMWVKRFASTPATRASTYARVFGDRVMSLLTGASDADAGLRVRGWCADLVRDERTGRVGADFHVSRAEPQRRPGRDPAGYLGTDIGNRWRPLRRGSGGLVAALHDYGAGPDDLPGDPHRGPLTVWLLTLRDLAVFVPVFATAFFFLSWFNGPIAAVIFDVVPPEISATVAGAYLLFIHLVGDAVAFPLIGALSDRFGLDRAVLLLPLVAILGGLVILGATRTVGRDMARGRG